MNEIKIALYGQYDNDTKFDFTFPDDFNPSVSSPKDAWLRSISDPRDGREFKTERIYTFWRNNEGNYYGVIVPNRRDSRNGYILLTLFVGRQLPGSGSDVIEILARLEQILITEDLRDKEAVRQYVDSVADKFIPDGSVPLNVQKVPTRAFRTYRDDRELAALLLYPHQQEYAPYSRILFVPSSVVPKSPIPNYTELRNVIRFTYTVVCPDGVKTDKHTVTDGSALEVSYMKNGFPPSRYKIPQVSAMGGKLYSVEGSILRIKTAEEAGITFKRRVRLNICSDKTGQPISMFTVNGEPKRHGEEYVLPDAQIVEFEIVANGFAKRSMKVEMAELMRANYVLKAYLKPQEKDLRVIATAVENGKEKRIEGEVKITPDDKLYPYLSDTRNYDLKIVPRKGAAPGGKGADKPASAYGGGNGLSPLVRTVLFALAGLVIGFILASVLLPSGGDDDDDPKKPSTKSDNGTKEDAGSTSLFGENDGGNTSSAGEDSPQEKQFEEEDLVYMKTPVGKGVPEVWVKDKLKSKKYQQLFQYFEDGDGDQIMAHPYNSATSKNGYFIKISEILKEINDGDDSDDKYPECVKLLHQHTKGGICQIQELASALTQLNAQTRKTTTKPSVPGDNKGGTGGNGQGNGNGVKGKNNVVGGIDETSDGGVNDHFHP
jgi:hypothetical protein